jgi:hypothetical protein
VCAKTGQVGCHFGALHRPSLVVCPMRALMCSLMLEPLCTGSCRLQAAVCECGAYAQSVIGGCAQRVLCVA